MGYGPQCQGETRVQGFSRSGKPRLLLESQYRWGGLSLPGRVFRSIDPTGRLAAECAGGQYGRAGRVLPDGRCASGRNLLAPSMRSGEKKGGMMKHAEAASLQLAML